MMRLPEKIRRTLEKLITELRVTENVYGVGLFGSWSRGDASTSSDVDLFILDEGNPPYEYVERAEVGGLLIDFNHVPRRWIRGPIPPELDQKLYEMHILYDRDWSLTNTKILMTKSYSSPERVDIRTEAHVIESDIYLSRATSALSRGDPQSACAFATVALENMLKILFEIALEPFSNSCFLEKLERAAAKIGMQRVFKEYLAVAELEKFSSAEVNGKLELFRAVWEEARVEASKNTRILESMHFKVKTKLNYYLNPAFLQGAILRTNALVENKQANEACHYLRSILLDITENYAWFKAATKKQSLTIQL